GGRNALDCCRLAPPEQDCSDGTWRTCGTTGRGCEAVSGEEICTFARDGGCDNKAALSFEINDVLARTGF
ncbi:MAG: hypothetical protein KGL35_24675, partial [Bradyrhizobium sp.]|nr:hypothetical protein [Bradyrhizobium sp.]